MTRLPLCLQSFRVVHTHGSGNCDLKNKLFLKKAMEFPPLKNDRLMRAIQQQEVDRVPVWIMRQAGRYLPEFREIRSKFDFFTICRTPELACEVTLQPIRRFDLDAAIIFSDILVVPEALGMTVEMKPGIGPVLPNPLITPDDIEKLNSAVDVTKSLDYVYKAVTLTRTNLEGKVPLIGFTGAPWTLMAYMVEGGGSKTMSKAKHWLYHWPKESEKLLTIISRVVTDHLTEQAKAGAQVLQLFESSAEYLGPDLFKTYSLKYLSDIIKKVKKSANVPIIVFCKGAHYAIPDLTAIACDVIGLDWTIDPAKGRAESSNKIALQGNLDPCALYAPDDCIKEMTRNMVLKFGKKGYIANLGHGIYPDVDPDKVKVFIDAVHSI